MDSITLTTLVSGLSDHNIDVCVNAAERLHKEAGIEDIPALLDLIHNDDAFVREAAAWPIAELAGARFLGELLTAYQRGFDEGHDNDGFTAALLEIPALHPRITRAALEQLLQVVSEPIRGHVHWLLEFCPETQLDRESTH